MKVDNVLIQTNQGNVFFQTDRYLRDPKTQEATKTKVLKIEIRGILHKVAKIYLSSGGVLRYVGFPFVYEEK